MNPLSIFTGSYGMLFKWGVIGVLCAGLFGFGWVRGNQHGTEKLTEYQGEQAVASIRVITRQGVATVQVVKEFVKVAGKTKIVTETVEKEVVKYVDSKPLTLACQLDNRWVRLHDAAAADALPPPAAGDDAASGGVNAAEALPSVTGNYARAIRNKNRLTFCQAWVREQYKATNGEELGY